MKKILIMSLVIALFLVSGCSKEKCWEREIKYTEIEKVETTDCQEIQAQYELTVLESEIKYFPNEATRNKDQGIVRFALLNKDEKIKGNFNVSVECVVASGNIVKTETLNLQQGERKEITLRCEAPYPTGILSVNEPVVDAVPTEEKCTKTTEEKPVEKTRYETVCE